MDTPEPPSHCYERTLRIENPSSCTAFVMNYEGQQWLVTAWHTVHDVKTGEEKPFKVFDQYGVEHSASELTMLDRQSSHADVTVFALWSQAVDFGPPLEPRDTAHDARPLQHVYFLGFPNLGEAQRYGLKYASPKTPLIKQAIVSGEAKHRSGLLRKIWLLDGMAHHGFSGGPVIIYQPEFDAYRVLGVISGYVPANARVLPWEMPAEPNQIGAAPPSPEDSFSETNSGIAICFDIENAIADIDAYLDEESAK